MPEKALNLVLYGKESGITGEELQFDDEQIDGNVYSGEFEGVVNQVKRWFATSTSEAIQRWAEAFMQLTTCKTCEGTRLRKESLWFKVDEKNIAELSNKDLVQLVQWFDGIENRLSHKQNIIAKEIIKRNPGTIAISVRCRTYLSDVEQADKDTEWRRVATDPFGDTNRVTIAGHYLCVG